MDPSQKPRLISALKREIPALSPRLAQVAKYILDHPSDFGLDPIRRTAEKTGVSTYTLIRLAQHFGFEGFEELRAPFRHALVTTSAQADHPTWIAGLQEQGEMGRAQAEAALNSLSIVQRSLHQDGEKMQRVVRLLLGASHVYLTGARASHALAYYFHYVGRMALPTLDLIARHHGSALDDLNLAKPGDVIIAMAFAPYSRETIDACLFAQERGLGLVLISDSEIIAPEVKPDEVLVASAVTTHRFGCFAGAMALVENLLALLIQQGGDAAQERIETYEVLRQNRGAYWSGRK